MQEEKSILGLFVHSFNKCTPVPGSVLEATTILENGNRVSVGLHYILTPSTEDEYITGKAVRLEIQRLIMVAIEGESEEDPGLGAELSLLGKQHEQKQEGRQ